MGYKSTRAKIKKRRTDSLPHAAAQTKVKLMTFQSWRASHDEEELYTAFSEYYSYYITALEDGRIIGNPSEFKVERFLIRQAELAFADNKIQEIDQSHVTAMHLTLSKAAIKSIEQRPLVVDYRAVAASILTEEEEERVEAARKQAYTET